MHTSQAILASTGLGRAEVKGPENIYDEFGIRIQTCTEREQRPAPRTVPSGLIWAIWCQDVTSS